MAPTYVIFVLVIPLAASQSAIASIPIQSNLDVAVAGTASATYHGHAVPLVVAPRGTNALSNHHVLILHLESFELTVFVVVTFGLFQISATPGAGTRLTVSAVFPIAFVTRFAAPFRSAHQHGTVAGGVAVVYGFEIQHTHSGGLDSSDDAMLLDDVDYPMGDDTVPIGNNSSVDDMDVD